MPTGFVIFGAFAALVAILIWVYERPQKQRRKISGRGGDFEG
jgi:hypothetical protein